MNKGEKFEESVLIFKFFRQKGKCLKRNKEEFVFNFVQPCAENLAATITNLRLLTDHLHLLVPLD